MLTYLQMLSPDELRPAPVPAVALGLVGQDRSSPLIRSATVGIGQAHHWPSQRWNDAQWRAYLDRPHLRHWIAVVDGHPAGLLSLDVPPGGEVEIETFGLLPTHVGRGIGGHFLTLGVLLAWDAAPSVSRVWLHTSAATIPLPCRPTSGAGSSNMKLA